MAKKLWYFVIYLDVFYLSYNNENIFLYYTKIVTIIFIYAFCVLKSLRKIMEIAGGSAKSRKFDSRLSPG